MNISTYDIAGANGITEITIDSDQPNQGPNVHSGTGFLIQARKLNSGVGRVSFVSSDSAGFEIEASKTFPFQVFNLNELYFSGTSGDKFVALKW
jgi:hypothetical protein